MAKLYHPDSKVSPDAKKFMAATEAYDWLVANHKPVPRPKPVSKDVDKFYRVLGGGTDHVIYFPFQVVDRDSVVHCMTAMGELKIFMPKGFILPAVAETRGIKIRVEYRFDPKEHCF